MPRGQKTTPEVVYKVMASWAVHQNKSEVVRELGLPYSTVKNIIDANCEKEEFVKLGEEKKSDFSKKATKIIDKAMLLIDRRFDRALEQETALDEAIEEIWAADKTEISPEEKKSLVSKLRALQLQDIKSITVALGTIYDKRALADGNATENVQIIGDEKLERLARLAGYEKRE